MKVEHTFKKMNSDKTLRDYSSKKISKLEKFLDHAIQAHFYFSFDRGQYTTELTLHGDHHNYVSEGQSNEKLGSIDVALEKMEAQLRKHKDKTKSHHHDVDVNPRTKE